jgi:hypothetical protein
MIMQTAMIAMPCKGFSRVEWEVMRGAFEGCFLQSQRPMMFKRHAPDRPIPAIHRLARKGAGVVISPDSICSELVRDSLQNRRGGGMAGLLHVR